MSRKSGETWGTLYLLFCLPFIPRSRDGLRSGGRYGAALLKAFAAENGTSLRGAERNRSFFAALRAGGARLNLGVMGGMAHGGWGAEDRDPFGFAGLAPLGFVAKLFVVKKELFPRGEDKIRTAVNTLQHLVLKFH
jgi:hypothetical protein